MKPCNSSIHARIRSLSLPLQFLLVAGLSITGRLIRFSGPTDISFDLQWMTSLFCAWHLPLIPVLSGIGLAAVSGYLIIGNALNPQVYGDVTLTFEIAMNAAILISIIVMVRSRSISITYQQSLKYVSLIAPLLCQLILMSFDSAHPFRLVYFTAAGIISVLIWIRLRNRNQSFALFHSAFLTGYTVLLILILLLDIDINAAGKTRLVFERFFLVPYPMFLLQMVLLDALTNTDSLNNSF